MRRLVAVPAVLCVALLGLSACGDDDGKTKNSGDVSVTGAFGEAPKVEYDGRVTRATTSYETLVKGDGEKVALGDGVVLNFYIGNGYTGEEATSTWTDEKPAYLKMEKDTFEAIREAVVGSTVGSRVEVLATPKDAFANNGNSGIGIGNRDAVVFVIDIMTKVLDGPEGEEQEPPADAPKVVETDGKPTSIDSKGAAKPTDALQVITLVKGDGPAAAKGQTVIVNYLGQKFGGKKPFDDSYSKGEPFTFEIPEGKEPPSVIKGWVKGVEGVTVGSRVLLVIPEKLGYGPKPKEDDGKPHGDLVFVIDVLGVA